MSDINGMITISFFGLLVCYVYFCIRFTQTLTKHRLQRLKTVSFVVSIISAYLLFSGKGVLQISSFDWLFANCEEWAKGQSFYGDYILGEHLWLGQEIQDELYQECRYEKLTAVVYSLILTVSISTILITSYSLQKTFTGDDKTDSSKLINGKNVSGNMIEEAEEGIQKPTKTSQISPIGPIEFDNIGYEWSTDKYERPIYRTAGSANHWKIWEQ